MQLIHSFSSIPYHHNNMIIFIIPCFVTVLGLQYNKYLLVLLGGIMKKLITVLLVLLVPAVLSASVFTVIEAGSQIGDSVRILSSEDPRDQLIDMNLAKLTLTEDVTPDELYRQEKLSLWGPAARSLFIGFGSGAKAIGDAKGEVIGAWGDGIGLGSALVGGFMIGIDWLSVMFVKSINEPDAAYEMSGFGKTGLIMVGCGGAVMALSRIVDTARVFIWGTGYNRRLRTVIHEHASVSLTPDAQIEAAMSFSW